MTDSNQGVTATIETSAGNITLEFLTDKAPKHVANFVSLAQAGFYNGTRFHRTIPGFMIQGGCPNTKDLEKSHLWGTGGPGHSVDAEFNDTPHVRGIFSMARSNDPNSAGSQFFLCHGEAGFLDGQYTAFGRMLSGDEALEAIATAPTEPGGEGSTPVNPVEITCVTIQRVAAEA
ncbi:MAG: peptidylprolyl isomerase [Planctomycetes bacterium]|jgi:peptidyl-prolyl cis-trans isomerase B (cyclophilin B)|nr:peptidylprolyl isomerase [Planctomycetota bacterium]HJO25939.1 peptidylprolyl isomerase [Planctomycetota bacterium]